MYRHYDQTTLVHFQDLRDLIKEEMCKIIEQVRLTEQENAKQNAKKEKPLSIQEVADRYNVSKATVHNWMNQEIIKGFKMGKGRYFYIQELEKNLTKYRYMEVLENKGLTRRQKTF